jgi:hypothetical protein
MLRFVSDAMLSLILSKAPLLTSIGEVQVLALAPASTPAAAWAFAKSVSRW